MRPEEKRYLFLIVNQKDVAEQIDETWGKGTAQECSDILESETPKPLVCFIGDALPDKGSKNLCWCVYTKPTRGVSKRVLIYGASIKAAYPQINVVDLCPDVPNIPFTWVAQNDPTT